MSYFYIQKCVNEINSNSISFLREDLIPYSFGGNKVRKALLFFEEIDNNSNDYVVSYGSVSSNHCRVVANMAAQRNMPCHIIMPEESSKTTNNSKLVTNFGATIETCPVDLVSQTIDKKMAELEQKGFNPYFIPGGGHGNIGTEAYVRCYQEIKDYEKREGISFDYIFFASGTGTTQAGLSIGQLINGDERNIVGISVARTNPRGKDVVIESIKEYLKSNELTFDESLIESSSAFLDDYTLGGYGKYNDELINITQSVMAMSGIPLDYTYTGKAYYGMSKYLIKNDIKSKNVLFIHTGGTPIFFDDLWSRSEEI